MIRERVVEGQHLRLGDAREAQLELDDGTDRPAPAQPAQPAVEGRARVESREGDTD
jgi:hypothetical protein